MTSPLRLDLDTAPFDKLVADARALIPQLAPGWTDHNIHDPGIMLVELAAWVADQQIYALSRDRRDERLAFAAAMGLRPAGPHAAQGVLWLRSDPQSAAAPWPNGLVLAAGADVSLDGRDGPGFALETDISLTSAQMAALTVQPAGEPAQAYPAQPPPGGLAPFGTPAAHGSRLEVRVDGDLLAPGATGHPALSLGVQTDCPAIADSRARMSAAVRLGSAEIPVLILRDGSHALGQSGVILLDLAPLIGQAPSGGATIVFTLEAALRPLPAKVMQIGLNVLPIRQETQATLDVQGTGQPGQEVALPAGVVFGPHVAPPRVERLPGEVWQASDDLSAAGPSDRVFAFDTSAGVIRFGNGLNGMAPPQGATFQVTYRATSGSQGLIPTGTAWTVEGTVGKFSNPQATTDGADPEDIVQLRRDSRAAARNLRPLVTDADLEAAAMAATDLRVARAEVLDGYRPDACARQTGLARTLVVMGADAGQDGSEPPAWLDILRRRIRPQLTLGDQVSIIRPAYVPSRLRATIIPRAGISPTLLANALDAALAARMRLVQSNAADAVWPLGLDLQAMAVAGWLRRVDGVAAVRDVSVGPVGGALGRSVVVATHGLPVLVRQPGDITIGSAS